MSNISIDVEIQQLQNEVNKLLNVFSMKYQEYSMLLENYNQSARIFNRLKEYANKNSDLNRFSGYKLNLTKTKSELRTLTAELETIKDTISAKRNIIESKQRISSYFKKNMATLKEQSTNEINGKIRHKSNPIAAPSQYVVKKDKENSNNALNEQYSEYLEKSHDKASYIKNSQQGIKSILKLSSNSQDKKRHTRPPKGKHVTFARVIATNIETSQKPTTKDSNSQRPAGIKENNSQRQTSTPIVTKENNSQRPVGIKENNSQRQTSTPIVTKENNSQRPVGIKEILKRYTGNNTKNNPNATNNINIKANDEHSLDSKGRECSARDMQKQIEEQTYASKNPPKNTQITDILNKYRTNQSTNQSISKSTNQSTRKPIDLGVFKKYKSQQH